VFVFTVYFFSLAEHSETSMNDQATVPIYSRCAICHRLYKDPKYLSCSHSCCEGCLVKIQEGSDVACGMCEAKFISVTISAYGQVGKEVKFIIITKDDNPHSCHKSSRKITAQVKLRTGDTIATDIIDNQDGSYTASFVPTKPGEVEVLVFVNGKTFNNHSFTVQVRQHTTLDKPNKVICGGRKFSFPWGIAFGKDGAWGMTDHSNHCVCIFDSQDQLTRKFGSRGDGNGQFSSPCGLAFDANNYLYVADYDNHRIQKFDIDGCYLLQFGKRGSGDGQLSYPWYIAVGEDKVFVTDFSNRISVFQCDGQYRYTFGSSHLSNPRGITVTNNNQVLVADNGHHCISIFTVDGNYVNKIGTKGSGRGQLLGPDSVCIDLYGFILVTDVSRFNLYVSVFDQDGVFVHCFKLNLVDPLHCDIACSPNGSIYVCCHNNKKIQIYSDY